MTEYQTHDALAQALEAEVSRLLAVNAELRSSIQAPIQPDTKLAEAARQALEAMHFYMTAWNGGEVTWFRECYKAEDKVCAAITALREALEAAPQPTELTQDHATWAITYDGRTPHTLWHEGDGPLFDLEIKRQGGSAQKMALYTAPINLACKSVQARLAAQWGYVKADVAGQEPVAYASRIDTDWPVLWSAYQVKRGDAQHPERLTPLYTAPQPARQPLTDRQIQDIWCSAKIEGNQHGPFWFARAIEREHGIIP